jgi:hypothetical protein
MKNKLFRAKLTISEPWEQSNSFTGILEETDLSGLRGLLFTSDDNKRYILSLRYKESKIDDIWMGKHVIVNIEEFISDSFELPNPQNQSPFEGIGSIEIITSNTN